MSTIDPKTARAMVRLDHELTEEEEEESAAEDSFKTSDWELLSSWDLILWRGETDTWAVFMWVKAVSKTMFNKKYIYGHIPSRSWKRVKYFWKLGQKYFLPFRKTTQMYFPESSTLADTILRVLMWLPSAWRNFSDIFSQELSWASCSDMLTVSLLFVQNKTHTR